MVITTKSGDKFEEYLEYPKGDPREPMTIDDLENKFNSLAMIKFNDAEMKHIKDVIFDCEKYSAKEFMGEMVAK